MAAPIADVPVQKDIATVVIDAERHILSQRPSGRVVAGARDQLLSQVDLAAFTSDIIRVARLVHIGKSAALAAGYDVLASDIASIASRVGTLFQASRTTIHLFDVETARVLDQLPDTVSLLVHTDTIDVALSRIEANDRRAFELAGSAETLAQDLLEASDRANEALERAQRHRLACVEDKRILTEQLDELNVTKDAAWETHELIVETLSTTSKEYTEAIRRERTAHRRARVFSMFGLVEELDTVLQRQMAINVLQPVTDALQGIRRDAESATLEREAALECKVEQRKRHASVLEDVMDSSKAIRDVSCEMDCVLASIDSLRCVASELKRLSTQVMRIAHFWRQVHANMSRLSSRGVVQLAQLTRPGADTIAMPRVAVTNTSGDEKDDEACSSSQGDDSDGKPRIEAGNESNSEAQSVAERSKTDSRSGASTLWEPATALKRRLVLYYAQWVAMSDLCSECVRTMRQSEDNPNLALGAEVEEITEVGTTTTTGQVLLLTRELRAELAAGSDEGGSMGAGTFSGDDGECATPGAGPSSGADDSSGGGAGSGAVGGSSGAGEVQR